MTVSPGAVYVRMERSSADEVAATRETLRFRTRRKEQSNFAVILQKSLKGVREKGHKMEVVLLHPL